MDIDFLLSLLFYGIPRNLGIVALVRAACTFRNFRACFCKTLFWFKKASKMHEKTMQNTSKRRQKSKNIAPFDHFEHMMGIYAGLVTPKSENVEKVLVFKAFLKGSRGPRVIQPSERLAEPDRPGGGRGRVNPPPRRLVWRFWGFGGLVQGLYTPRGQRPRRIIKTRCPVLSVSFD